MDIGLYSGNKITPNTDNFFAEGLLFRNSYSQNNWTLPTFASMVTSQYATEHGVVDPDKYINRIDRSIQTLPEIMQKNGFFTYGSVSHIRANQSLGHHRGFDHFSFERTVDDKLGSPGIRGSNNMILQIREICDYLKNFNNINFFGFIHFFDTHFPYLYNKNKKYIDNLLFENDVSSFVQKSFNSQLTDGQYKFIIEEYLSRLNELDYHLEELYRLLNNMENTTVILTSDHGYSFDNLSGGDLCKEKIRTPYLIHSNEFPLENDFPDRFVESSIDLMPTITNLFSIKDETYRSGTPMFDNNYKVINKEFAISELTYHNKYQMKIVGKEDCHLLIDGLMNRKTLNKIYHSFRVKSFKNGLKSKKDFELFMKDIVQKLNFDKQTKITINKLIEDLDY